MSAQNTSGLSNAQIYRFNHPAQDKQSPWDTFFRSALNSGAINPLNAIDSLRRHMQMLVPGAARAESKIRSKYIPSPVHINPHNPLSAFAGDLVGPAVSLLGLGPLSEAMEVPEALGGGVGRILSNLGEKAGLTPGLIRGAGTVAKTAAAGAGAGAVYSPPGTNLQGAITGGALGPVFHGIGQLARKLVSPTRKALSKEFGIGLVKKATESVPRDELSEPGIGESEEGGAQLPKTVSDLDEYANTIKTNHDNSAARYKNLYDKTGDLAKRADKSLPARGDITGIDISKPAALRNAVSSKLEDRDYSYLEPEEKQKIVEENTPRTFSDYLDQRKALNKNFATNKFTPSENASKIYANNSLITPIKNILDKHFQDVADRIAKKGDTLGSRTIALRKKADAAYGKHQELYYEMPSAVKGDVPVKSTNLRTALKNKRIPKGSLISRNFSSKPTEGTINKLSSLLGGKEGGNPGSDSLNKARDAMKMVLFDRAHSNQLTPEEGDKILKTYSSLDNKVKQGIFKDKSSHQLLGLAQQWKSLSKGQQWKDTILHHVTPATLGATVGGISGALTGIPHAALIAGAAAAGVGGLAKILLAKVGKASIRRILKNPNIDKLIEAVNSGRMSPTHFSNIVRTGASTGTTLGLENSPAYRRGMNALIPALSARINGNGNSNGYKKEYTAAERAAFGRAAREYNRQKGS